MRRNMKLRASCMFIVAALSIAGVAQATDPPSSTETLVRVHVDADGAVSLERRSAANAPWEHACDAPCDQMLPAADQYRFGATPESPESKPFVLDLKGGATSVTIKAQLADKKKKQTGLYVLVGAGALVVGGVVVFLAGLRPSHTFDADGATHDVNWNVATVGSLLVAGGVAGGIVGGTMFFGNTQTRAGGAVRTPDAPSKSGVAPAPAGVGFVMPVWTQTF
jgi:hypothetical protein